MSRSDLRNRRLLDLRAKKGWSQEKLAQRARLSLGTINKAETGKQEPNVLTKQRIARALGVERGDIWPEEQAS